MKNSNSIYRSAGLQRGFTLTELLVVILIIVVLATLALFGTQRMRSMADKANAIRNLNQLQVANMSYAADHSGKCVPLKAIDDAGKVGNRWFINVDFLACLTGKSSEELEKNPATAIPLEMLDPKVVRARKPQYDRVYTSYGMNDTGIGGSKPSTEYGYNLNRLTDPSRSMVFASATDFRATYVNRYKWDFKNPKDEKTAGGEIAYRHGNKALVVYFDRHVAEMGKADFQAIDKAGGVNNVFWTAQPPL